MRYKGFTIIEIIIAIFILVMIASILIPLNMSNLKQAERVAKWKNTYEEVVYSLTLLAAKNPEIQQLAETDGVMDSKDTLKALKPYLNVDESRSHPDYFKNYHYKFLNGKKISKNSDYYMCDFITLNSGVIVGFKCNNKMPRSHSDPRAVMVFDVNGLEKPNRMGKDVFGVYLYSNKIKPFGEDSSLSALKTNCSPIGTGILCSKYYLIGSSL